MQQLVFTNKFCDDEFDYVNRKYHFPLKKPKFCPRCGVCQDAKKVDRFLFPEDEGVQFGIIYYECTCCLKRYITVYEINFTEKLAKYNACFPTEGVFYENSILLDVSPKFINAYSQALRCELRGDIELAAVGFRHAIECLIKDFAINELGASREEVVKKSLCNAISAYLDEHDLVATADVVRILGNDYAHYERKYPECDFQQLKRYVEIFAHLVETKVLIMHPPVSRYPAPVPRDQS